MFISLIRRLRRSLGEEWNRISIFTLNLMHHEFRNSGIPTERHATVVQNAGRADQKSVSQEHPNFYDAHV